MTGIAKKFVGGYPLYTVIGAGGGCPAHHLAHNSTISTHRTIPLWIDSDCIRLRKIGCHPCSQHPYYWNRVWHHRTFIAFMESPNNCGLDTSRYPNSFFRLFFFHPSDRGVFYHWWDSPGNWGLPDADCYIICYPILIFNTPHSNRLVQFRLDKSKSHEMAFNCWIENRYYIFKAFLMRPSSSPVSPSKPFRRILLIIFLPLLCSPVIVNRGVVLFYGVVGELTVSTMLRSFRTSAFLRGSVTISSFIRW